jgi:hypothetical protein
MTYALMTTVRKCRARKSFARIENGSKVYNSIQFFDFMCCINS